MSFISANRHEEQMNSAPQTRALFQAILGQVYDELDHAQLPEKWTSGSIPVQGCLPLLMEEVPAAVLIERLGQEKYERLRALHRHSSLLNLWYSLALQQVLKALVEANIPVMVLKGADIACTLYPRPELRHFGDVDLMVPPGHLEDTFVILQRLGYHYHQEYRFETISRQRSAFVYVKEVTGGHLVFEVHTAPHSNEMGISFDPRQIWQRGRTITIADVQVKGMGLEDLLLYLCWHYRSHAFNRLIWLYDIAIVLQRCSSQIDWNLAYSLARQRGLVATISYCMQWCQQVFGIVLSENTAIKKLNAPRFTRWLVQRLVGDDRSVVLCHTAFRERKILQRLLVDSVMALCLVVLHLLVPSPTHLGRLYAERSRLPVQLFWLYYPLHPLIVLNAYIRRRHR